MNNLVPIGLKTPLISTDWQIYHYRQRLHAIKRAQERYQLGLDEKEYSKLVKMIHHNTPIKIATFLGERENNEIYAIHHPRARPNVMLAIYHVAMKQIATFLPELKFGLSSWLLVPSTQLCPNGLVSHITLSANQLVRFVIMPRDFSKDQCQDFATALPNWKLVIMLRSRLKPMPIITQKPFLKFRIGSVKLTEFNFYPITSAINFEGRPFGRQAKKESKRVIFATAKTCETGTITNDDCLTLYTESI